MSDQATLPLSPNSTIKITGFTNTSSWQQKITLQPSGGSAVEWTGTSTRSNKVVGQLTLAKSPQNRTLQVMMFYNDGAWKSSSIIQIPFSLPGLAGFVVGGQDGGGRPNGPAFWNTIVFVYWAQNY